VVPKGVSKITVVFANGDHVPGQSIRRTRRSIGAGQGRQLRQTPAARPSSAIASKLNAGQWAIAVGEPFELKQSVSVGVVSGFNRDEPIQDDSGNSHLFRGNAPDLGTINPGNSGGPLVDDQGRLIGVNQSTANPQPAHRASALRSPRTSSARPRPISRRTRARRSTRTARARRRLLGVQTGPLDANVRAQINFPATEGNGVVVMQIPANGPAAKSDLAPAT